MYKSEKREEEGGEYQRVSMGVARSDGIHLKGCEHLNKRCEQENITHFKIQNKFHK